MEMEREELCYGVEEFLERYVPEPSLHGENETTYRTVMETTCDIVSGYIKELVVRLEKLEMSIRKDEGPTEFLTMIRPYFG